MSNRSWKTPVTPVLIKPRWEFTANPDDMAELDEEQVAEILGVARTSLVNYRSSKRLKIPFHMRDGSPAYFWGDVKEFMADVENVTWKLAREP